MMQRHQVPRYKLSHSQPDKSAMDWAYHSGRADQRDEMLAILTLDEVKHD